MANLDNDIIVSSLAEGQIKVWLNEREEENSSSTSRFAWHSIWIVFFLLYRRGVQNFFLLILERE